MVKDFTRYIYIYIEWIKIFLFNSILFNNFTILDATYVIRKLLPILSSSFELIKLSDDIYILNIKRKLFRHSLEFTINEEFEEKMMNGRKVKSIITFENNTMTHIQNNDPPLKIVRNFFNDEMVTIMYYKDVVSTSWYKDVE